MKEADIQKKIITYLESRGAVVNKTIGMSKAGWPDLIGCWQGRFIGIEVKRPKQPATPLQHYKIEQLKGAGGLVCIATCVEDAEDLLNEAF